LAASSGAQTERDSILNSGNTHVASWAYYTDSSASRWYISQIASGKVDVYSLGPIVNHMAGWWTVGQGAASINISGNSVSVDPGLDHDPSNSFYDIGLGQWLNNPQIHLDRQKIQGSAVPIKWFFFQAPNQVWYIVNAPGYGTATQILKFSELNGNYDWKATDTVDFIPILSNSDGTKYVRFTLTSTAGSEPLVVNGHTLQGNDDRWVRFVATTVVPQLAGSRSTRLQVAARASWWGLKEGTFSKDNPHAFSSCGANQPLGPLETCAAGQAWQVGLAAVQVGTFTEQTVLNQVQALWPGRSVTDILAETAQLAGYDPAQGTGAAIVASSGVLRKSWLLRHPTVGITFVEQSVTAECINASATYCYGTSWTQTAWYAPTKQGALQSISDLTAIFNSLAP
jgi:hypothetical protein